MARASDVPKMREILAGRGGSNELYAKLDLLVTELEAERDCQITPESAYVAYSNIIRRLEALL